MLGRSGLTITIMCFAVVLLAVLGILSGCRSSDDAEEPDSGLAGSTETLGIQITATSAAITPEIEIPPQTLDFKPETAILESVADAEEEGENWPAASPPETPSSSFEELTTGSPERVCVEVQPGVSDTGAWRSGEFLAGHFDVYLEERPKDPRYSKLWWLPLHNDPDDLVGVTVRAVRLEGQGEPIPMEIFGFDQFAWPGPPPEVTPTPLPPGQHPDYFYPSGLELSTAGRWMLVATMGPDWGCYIIDLSG